MRTLLHSAVLLASLLIASAALAAGEMPQSMVTQGSAAKQQYPKIVLYSVSWCPHCKEAKEYFTHNNIPFINKDVEVDEAAMTELTKKYKSQGVPVIVIGDDKVIIKGFSEERFKQALKDAQVKK
ncbi:MAG TPA: glutaredoxin domain-containing protein [Geobacteraceae bacterium]